MTTTRAARYSPRDARLGDGLTDRQDIRRYRANLQSEVDSAALYHALSEAEPNPPLKLVYARLAAVEEAHAQFWRNRLARLGVHDADGTAGWRTRGLAWIARRFGPHIVLPMVQTLEREGMTDYDAQHEAVDAGMPAAERSHARIIGAVSRPVSQGISGGTLASLEGRHRSLGGNALRAAVLGANDGLVSNLSLVMGVAGAALQPRAILVTGLAGLLAGACSMAMGEWLSVNSARELAQSQIDVEADELRESPEEEKQELILIYQAKGIDEAQAKLLADRIIANQDTALDTLTREELGIDPKDLGGSAWVAGGTSFLLFALGAIVPVLPFFFAAGWPAIVASLGVSALVMFAIGAGTTLFTGRGALFSGTRQLAIGLGAAAITFGLGRLIGTAIGG
ncbi:MAG TPA: VIT1/CCC1 transporter family protein [Stellaceae bacterium]|nr:VIT1/CCC1 transporter family protein [Stellaceae bacterium]